MYFPIIGTSKKLLCFKRWSNKAYAVFNSIGKSIKIGNVSSLIERLVTVKSSNPHGFLMDLSTVSVDEDEYADIPSESTFVPALHILDRKLQTIFVCNASANAAFSSLIALQYSSEGPYRALFHFHLNQTTV